MKKLLLAPFKLLFKLIWILIQYALVIALSVPVYSYLGKPFLASFVYHPEIIDEKICLPAKNDMLEAWAALYSWVRVKRITEYYYDQNHQRTYELSGDDLLGIAQQAECGQVAQEDIKKFIQHMENLNWKKFLEEIREKDKSAYQRAVAACCHENFWWQHCAAGVPEDPDFELDHLSPGDEEKVLETGKQMAHEYVERTGQRLKECPDVRDKFVSTMKLGVDNWFPAPRE